MAYVHWHSKMFMVKNAVVGDEKDGCSHGLNEDMFWKAIFKQFQGFRTGFLKGGSANMCQGVHENFTLNWILQIIFEIFLTIIIWLFYSAF